MTEIEKNGINLFKVSNNLNNLGVKTLNFEEGRGYLTVPDHVIGIVGVAPIANTYVNSMFGFRYQFFLNDFYNFYAYDILNLEMTMQYIETLEFLIEGKKPKTGPQSSRRGSEPKKLRQS